MVVNTPGRDNGQEGAVVESDPLARLKSVVETPGRGMVDEPGTTGTGRLWVEAIDPSSGHVYYQNTATGESQWEKPF